MKREFLDYVEDIIEAMNDAMGFVEGISYDEFVSDKKTIYAVLRAVEIIGEAVKKIPDYVRKSYPDIPWREMSGMRDKLIHEYFGVDLQRVWRTVREDIPTLKPLFERMLRDLE
ncbi:MAG: DUF86 domain-containing protein [Candidatus Brockarchaeota archaeon]|nr:DUF86 domain-containing protein [Candidatus Brockarchaeota archaeon]